MSKAAATDGDEVCKLFKNTDSPIVVTTVTTKENAPAKSQRVETLLLSSVP